ncbi:MAG: DEAD/DEAH box helicase [Zoogloeaceae bacterium]|jgi:ATP-dependent RNA helicase DeaD|nr:DEAD/DEAH box helicase [Zoogloeaceae bacterium]
MTESSDSFAALQLPPALLSALAEVGYETPSPIQAACIPSLLAGRDVLGEAQTGTGKTAAFALPTLARIDLTVKKPQALVLTPTRELAIQVAEAFQKYAKHLPGFHVLPVYGGQSMVVQLRALSRGAHVIVGTPGRVMDHLERKSLSLDTLQTLVLDEADEMLRMGFIEDIEWILEHTPKERQTALFSATMPEPIRRITKRYQRDPEHIKIKSVTATVATIRQRYWVARGADKLDALTRILEAEDDFDAAIIFVRTKLATVDLAEKLEARGLEAAALNGDMHQGMREQVIERLKNGGLDIVVATDVAARGIDVPRISHVINYDVPYDTEAYVHRIGRTGRAGRAGSAILFVAPREMRMLKAIETATRQKIEPVTLPTAGEVAERRVAQFQQQILETLGNENLDYFYDVIRRMEGEQNVATRQIAAALAFLATRDRPLQPDLPDIPAAPPAREYGEKPQREKRAVKTEVSAKPTLADGELRRYRIEVGRNLGATPKEIVGAIANEGGIAGKYIGQIHVFAEFATVELPADLPKEVMATLKKTRVKQTPLNLRLFDGEAPEPYKAPRKAPSKAPGKTRFDKPTAAPRKRKP